MTALQTSTLPARLEDFTYAEIERRNIEIWAGEVVEKMSPAGSLHGRIVIRLVSAFLKLIESGRPFEVGLEVVGDNDGFIVSRSPDVFLCPDAALYLNRPEGPGPWHDSAPDVAVEVRSPEDRMKELLRKRDLYFKGGTLEFWLLLPERQVLEIHYRDGRIVKANGRIQITEGPAEGLSLDVAKLLAPL